MIITIIVKIGSRKVSVKGPRRMDSNFAAAAFALLCFSPPNLGLPVSSTSVVPLDE